MQDIKSHWKKPQHKKTKKKGYNHLADVEGCSRVETGTLIERQEASGSGKKHHYFWSFLSKMRVLDKMIFEISSTSYIFETSVSQMCEKIHFADN